LHCSIYFCIICSFFVLRVRIKIIIIIGFQSEHCVEPGKMANVNAPSAAYVDASKTTRVTGVISTATVAPTGAKVCFKCHVAGHIA